jgi:hypothetical protein
MAGGCPTEHTVPPSIAAWFESGTRLRAHVLDGGDGAALLVDWRDTELDETCAFIDLEDGTKRCVPIPSNAAYRVVFSDAGCTVPAAIAYATPLDYVHEPLPSCSQSAIRVHTGGTELGSLVAYQRIDGACIGETISGGTLFSLDAVDTTRFVSATVTLEQRGALAVEVLTAEDGAKQLGRAIDRDRAQPCTVSLVDFEETELFPRCLPPNEHIVDGYFTTRDCSSDDGGAFYCSFDGCAAPPLGIRRTPSDACATPTFRLFEIGPAVPSFADRMSEGCVEVSFGPCTFHPPAAEIAPELFPELADGALGTGRLRALVRTAAGDPRPILGRNLFRDQERGELCRPMRFDDDVLRCVSIDAKPINYSETNYSDATCTQRVVTGSGCGRPPPYALELDHAEGVIDVDAPVRALHRAGAAHIGDVYLLAGGTCSLIGPATDAWLVEDPLAPTTLPIVTDRIE